MTDRPVTKILIVDDEPDLREMLVDGLSEADLEVRAVASGQEAIELVRNSRVDFLVTDLRLGDCTGLDVLDELHAQAGDVPAVVITGYGDATTLSEASRRRPVELMTKPLDVERLRSTIRQELHRRQIAGRWQRRARRLRRLARDVNRQRKAATDHLETTCADLTEAYRALSEQLGLQKLLLNYQRDLLAARDDDNVFRTLFRLFVRCSGPLFGVAMVCDADAVLQIIGRFGVPVPDTLKFCQAISSPLVEAVLTRPQCTLLDATDELDRFEESIRKYLVGVNILAVPLIPSAGEMIGLAILYRKGEQPFCDEDIVLAEAIALPTALAIQKND